MFIFQSEILNNFYILVQLLLATFLSFHCDKLLPLFFTCVILLLEHLVDWMLPHLNSYESEVMPNVQERFSYLGIMDYHNLAYFSFIIKITKKKASKSTMLI